MGDALERPSSGEAEGFDVHGTRRDIRERVDALGVRSPDDLRADDMHTTKQLCVTCRDTFAETPTPEQLASSVWSIAEKMPRETMMALVVELLSAHLRREGVGEASRAG